MKNRFLFVLPILVAVSMGVRADSETFTVTNTNDSGAGSLRAAITAANNASPECESQTIQFNVPGSGVHTIQPLSPLPNIAITVTLNGYSQPGSSQNTLTDGENAVITMELDGSLAGSSNGLSLVGIGAGASCSANGSVVSGLVINNFALAGIDVQASPCHNGCFEVGQVYIEGSFIGTDTMGKHAKPNGVGLHFGINSVENIVGDQVTVDGGGNPTPNQALRNIISGNASDGVRLDSTDSTMPALSHRIRGNYIGVDATGAVALPNGRYGVLGDLGSSGEEIQNNIIAAHSTDGVRILDGQQINVAYNAIGVGVGGVALGNAGDGIHVGPGVRGVTTGFPYPSLSGLANPSVAFNAGAGLYVEGKSSVDVVYGSFGNNTGLGIDLAPRGVNPNDAAEADTGPNELLDAPVLTSATYSSVTSPPTTITGTLTTAPSSSSEIDIYLSARCDPSGYGEGAGFIGSVNNVKADASGHATFSTSTYANEGFAVTAVTRQFDSNYSVLIASEFSNCIVIGDKIFSDGFEP